ncbi:MAG: agmatinase [Proteobacteria bacterium]|nr:agmatinase [Pseudomonadota bacterium]
MSGRGCEPEPDAFHPVSTRLVPRFAGTPTFLRLPQHADPSDVDVMICGVPFDGGTTFRPGARFGPRGVRNASALTRGYHPAQGVDLFRALRCCDGGDVLSVPMQLTETLDRIEQRVSDIVTAGATPVLVGGDHTISIGALRALAKHHGPLAMLHFDAHSDTFGPAWGVDLHHGSVFRKALEEGLLRTRDVLQVGIRGPFASADDLKLAEQAGFEIRFVDDVKRDLAAVGAELSAFRTRGPCYVSFDVDAIDPAYAPGTGTPVPGGLTSYEALFLVRALTGVQLAGFDLVEISPDHDVAGITTLLGATLLAEVLASLAASSRSTPSAAPDARRSR